MYAKCICRVPDPNNWTVIHLTGRDRVIRCACCRQIWHSTAAYAQELNEDLVSPYQWRSLIKTPDYHKSEAPVEGEENGYLDPSLENRLDPPRI